MAAMKTIRDFFTSSALIIAAPLPLASVLTFKTGGWPAVLLVLAGGLALGLLYWWPLGAFLALPTERRWIKILCGYLLSLPLYFLTLAVLYPLWGGSTFHPLVNGRWIIYLSATPQFYAMVLLRFYLSTSRRTARWTMRATACVLAVGILAPLYLMATTSPRWPQQGN